MDSAIVFQPSVPLWLLWAALALAVFAVGLALWRGLSGWWLRALASAAILAAIANPVLQSEDREPLTDIVLAVVDRSASQSLSDRPDQTDAALAALETEVAALGNTELRVAELGDADDNQGTLLMAALAKAMAEIPRQRFAGAVLVTDGRLHDIEQAPDLPAPLHVLLTGREGDWDRRLLIQNAPAFAILGEETELTFRIDDDGAVPAGLGGTTPIAIAIDGGEPQVFEVPVGRDMTVPIRLSHGGLNVLQITVPEAEGELTTRNNAAVVQINGVRDRLRVLLVSGAPHPGERTWRNLLKSDSSVDLVHFTILRPPEKQDGIPVNELSLIAFPTRELFLEKIDEFDLIIFDRYLRRGILPSLYLDNVRAYVETGGAVLIAAGPDFAGASSLYRSPLGQVTPGAPTGRVIEDPFTPLVTDLGERHPVTEGLADHSPRAGGMGEDDAPWGRWVRLVEVEETAGNTVMAGPGERPLLLLDRVGEGRMALLASDHAWLWSRGYEGGGPQLELLRRLAHWLMKEPELDEEALVATAEGKRMTITRRTLSETAGDITITAPDGTETTVTPAPDGPGRFTATWDAPEMGLYRLTDGEEEAVVALGPAAPKEFEQTVATPDLLEDDVDQRRGGILPIEAGLPDLRQVRDGRPAAGRGWIGITPREAFLTADITVRPFLPSWAFLLLAAGLVIAAWLWEGRRARA